MILIDTSVWADHISHPDVGLTELLERGRISIHPFVIGELALGNLRDRSVLRTIAKLPRAPGGLIQTR